ncbi:hypothetical protein CDN99_13225 [Roseateles aquatilis]|uniref:DUF4234 domain-containing protein n=1 Tax=Roseateles aquatilis TaxID=431061 RepID=A0A246JCK7_9BURK|nr:hypothetical protein [Roseateles aquatilis]OWQ90324.1 hypothetical protein CDN99_13225 [Roseateles aquatilis]
MSQHAPLNPTAPVDAASDITTRFAPPQAHVAPVALDQAQARPMWFSVSPVKLLVMCTVTLQFYTVYWFYKQWNLVRLRERSSIIPVARAVFSFFFVWGLFKRVRDSEGAAGASLNAGGLAIGWIVASLMWKAPTPGWWLAMIAPLFLLPAQIAMNAVNATVSPGNARNDRFSVLNWIAIVVGSLFILMALIGTFLPHRP